LEGSVENSCEVTCK